MRTSSLRAALLAGAALSLAAPALAHDAAAGRGKELFQPGLGHAATAAAAAGPGHPPLYEGLAAAGMTVTTSRPEAQAYFDQGLRLAWGFNHAEARRSFAHARTLDPECAMCWWGEAFVIGPNINDAMDEADILPAWEAVSHAKALAGGAGAKEAMLIDALAARYGADATAARPELDLAWAEAMGRWPRDGPKTPTS